MLEYEMLSWVKRGSFKYLEGLVAVFLCKGNFNHGCLQ